MNLGEALAKLQLKPGTKDTIDQLCGLLEPIRDVRTSKLICRATAECAARALEAWQARGRAAPPEIVQAVDYAAGYLRGDRSPEELGNAIQAAWEVWADTEPDSPEQGLAELAAGCGTPVPDCGVEHVLGGILLMFSESEASDYARWLRDRLVELLQG